jgi:hypothetical protein
MRPNTLVPSIVPIASLLVAAAIAFAAPPAFAADKTGVPPSMLYEGHLTDSNGTPLPDGKYDFTFALYTGATGGTPIWIEEHKRIVLSAGRFRALLGNGTTPVPLDLPFDRPYFLAMRVDGGPELVPRLELATSAYSFRARAVDSVPDGSITGAKLAPLSVTNDHIQSVSWDKITGAPSQEEVLMVEPAPKQPAVPAHTWHITGNLRIDPTRNYIGTADSTDLSFRTNATERMRIYAYGKIVMRGDLDVEGYVTSRKTTTEGGFLLCDPQHGLKRFGNDDVRLFTTGGNILLEGGNVGIGTPAPTASLHVSAASGVPTTLRITNGASDRLTVDDAGRVRISSTATGSQDLLTSYPLAISGGTQGIAITVNENADSDNNFVSFLDPRGFRGRIEGQSVADVFTDPEYDLLTAIDAIEITVAGIELAGAASSANACVGLGVVACPPVPSLIAAATASLVAQIARTAITQAFFWNNLGVAYESGSADYAEWLERARPAERMEPGDIVGVAGGKVSKSTAGAHKLLVVSRAPIVLGNMPQPEEEKNYEKIAFLGQVPVKVAGPVRTGDYIIPSGLEDGTGIAVAPELMTADEFMKAVGRAWTASESPLVKYVTVAVGLDSGDIARVVRRQQAEIEALRREMRSLAARIGEPEAGGAYGAATGDSAAPKAAAVSRERGRSE